MVGDEVLVFVLFFFDAAFVVVHPVVDFGDGGFYVVYGHFEDAVAKGCADALFVEGLSHFLDDFFDVVEVDFFCDGYEFVAAYAEDAVLVYDGAHGAGHFPECFIACFVAVGVVDVFEVIEVSVDEGDGFALRDVLHESHEAVPVHDSCELVGVPELSQAFVDVSVADEDAEESGDGCQEEGGVFQSVGCRVDDFDETEGFPVDGKVPGDEAVDFDGTLALFSFSTFIGILFYARCNVAYLFGDHWGWQTAYKLLALAMMLVGGVAAYTVVWDLGSESQKRLLNTTL